MRFRWPRWRPRVWIALSVAAALVLTLPVGLEPHITRRVVDAIGQRFDSSVDVESLSISLLPRPRIVGRRLVLHHKRRTDVPPLIKVASFSATSSLTGFLRPQLHIARVELEGLEINIPPGGIDVDDDGDVQKQQRRKSSPLVVEELIAKDATLRILRRTAGKSPRSFEIHHLSMSDVGSYNPWPFRADMTNPQPPGEIHTEGTFGPWNLEDPSRTPLAASYRFDNANLGVFDGIEGVLASTGKFTGVLERIEADGETRVPAFALSDAGNPVSLTTRFHSIIDGTNGNTLLQPVDAQFLNTKIHAAGGVVETEGQRGRTVTLDIVLEDARFEDVLHLAVKGSKPPMTGRIKIKAALVLPPGHVDAMEKLNLDGTFEVSDSQFTKAIAQERLEQMSSKARGVSDVTPSPVSSRFSGTFRMHAGVIHFPDVAFTMPGARVNVTGQYAMKTQAVDFRGLVRLDAKLSSLTTGVKSMVLRMFDGLFRHRDVTQIPITITGSAKEPKVKLDFGRVLKGG